MADLVFGEKGWYWEMPNGRLGVAVTDQRLLNKCFNESKEYRYPAWSEAVFYLSARDFRYRRIDKLLQVDMSKQRALKKAHNERHDFEKSRPLEITPPITSNDKGILVQNPAGSTQGITPVVPEPRDSASTRIYMRLVGHPWTV